MKGGAPSPTRPPSWKPKVLAQPAQGIAQKAAALAALDLVAEVVLAHEVGGDGVGDHVLDGLPKDEHALSAFGEGSKRKLAKASCIDLAAFWAKRSNSSRSCRVP